MESKTYNIDCMEYMRGIPDRFFELAVVDPPYGLGTKRRRDAPGAAERFVECMVQAMHLL